MEHLLGRQQQAVIPASFAPIIGKPARANQRATCTLAAVWSSLYEDSSGNNKPDKQRSGDGIVALVMALGRATVRVERPEPRITLLP